MDDARMEFHSQELTSTASTKSFVKGRPSYGGHPRGYQVGSASRCCLGFTRRRGDAEDHHERMEFKALCCGVELWHPCMPCEGPLVRAS